MAELGLVVVVVRGVPVVVDLIVGLFVIITTYNTSKYPIFPHRLSNSR